MADGEERFSIWAHCSTARYCGRWSDAPICNAAARGRGTVPDGNGPAARTFPRKRADARRNEQALLDAAAAVFVASGVDAPVRDIAAAAGVGMGTIYRHFPTRAEIGRAHV